MSHREQALRFSCQGEQLLGVLAVPADAALASGTGVVVVVGGPQYRAGAHRQFVQLARALAAAGHSVLRFDVRGMGDSGGAQRGFEAVSDDIRAAVDALVAEVPACRQVVLMGLCDGASASLLYLHDTGDRRVRGLCLLNPWVRSEESLARAHVQHYYLRRLASPVFWRQLLTGGIGAGALRGFAGTLAASLRRTAPAAGVDGRGGLDFRMAMCKGCQGFGGPILLALSEHDLTAKEFAGATASDATWRHTLSRSHVQQLTLADADHTLSDTPARQRFENAVASWLATFAPLRT